MDTKMDTYTKRERNLTMSPQHGGNQHQNNHHYSPQRYNNGKTNGRNRATSSPIPYNSTSNGKRDKGVVEKLLNSYGFLECSSTSYRVFFHYSELDGDPNTLAVGDCLEFVLTTDPRNHKMLAIQLTKLPPGSVAVETLSEEQCFGRIEVEPKIQRNVDIPDVTTLGRVSYDKSGEFFFLPFSITDIEKGETIHKGDNVSFYVATNKRTGSLKARKLKFSTISRPVNIIQGIVSSLKESFGFIERADKVEEIFFHYSEFNGTINELLIGDDVEYELQDRAGKEIAIDVKKLPAGTVVFEDISEARFKGHVIKSNANRALSNTMDGHLTGQIEYQGKTDTHEVLFGDRDTEDDILLQKGDIVEFNVSTDRRDKLQRAVNIRLISVCVPNGQKRDVGVITSLKEGFGFIRCVDQDLSIFFHFSEVVEQSRVMNLGDEVEFTIQDDVISRRQHAIRVRSLQKGTISFEIISPTMHSGIIDQEAVQARSLKSPSKHNNKEHENGFITAVVDGNTISVHYYLRDCKPRDVPHYKDKVEFTLVTKKSTGLHYARDVNVIEKSEIVYKNGYVCALKDSFGFIELDNHEREVFFHFSSVIDGVELELGDQVQFMETKTSEKLSAEQVKKMPSNGKMKDEIISKTFDGVVARPMRTVDPEQKAYEGLIEVSRPDDGVDEKMATTYPFGITSISEKKEALQIGNKVTFQVCIDSLTKIKRATNILCKRNVMRGRIDSVKGQFGFIIYDNNEDGKSVFFHMTEVIENENHSSLRAGDEVSFVLVKNHKNAKKSAVRVQKIIDERPEYLTRRRSKKFSECASNGFAVLRTPAGPDGSGGFKLSRITTTTDVIKEQLSAVDLSNS